MQLKALVRCLPASSERGFIEETNPCTSSIVRSQHSASNTVGAATSSTITKLIAATKKKRPATLCMYFNLITTNKGTGYSLKIVILSIPLQAMPNEQDHKFDNGFTWLTTAKDRFVTN